MSPKSPDPVDVQVGARIRLLRQEAQITQTVLAEHLGVTFQQVQKYEKGMNRVGAGRLTNIARVLEVPVSRLLVGDEQDANEERRRGRHEERSPLKLLSIPGALRLLRAYAQINDGPQRRNILALVERIVSGPGKAK
jgi:transcriptional regulator with XRE-family HTH domain